MQPNLQIFLLGSFRLKVNGLSISASAWQKRKAKLLVQLLALKPAHESHREELIEILFPDADYKTASANFYRVLHRARKVLEPDRLSYVEPNFLVTEGQIIKFSKNGGLWIDSEEFELRARNGLKTGSPEILKSAFELYKGDLLKDEPFEDWIINRREHLKTLFHLVLRRLAEIAERCNAPDETHYWLDRILQHEPADETAHRAKIRLYAAQGDSVLALRQYEKCREVLKRELAVEPDEETKQLKQKIVVLNRK